ncbi:MAG: hypothetical protein CNC06_04405 [Pelagibacterales bacterium MED-G40]|nr:MAG: hypothetical protein CNC06_04405 [Pelagibacterales bacterium MED-G40]|tara:strand:+ start:73 stop:534 length:462 start_codon:yes stop_codon:yes gene_type:complete
MSIEDQLKKLKIKLPNAPAPVGSYAAFKKVNNLVFISGQISIDEGGKILKGKVGKDLKLEDGIKGAQLCCLNILAQLKKACNEDLNKVKNCIQIAGYINSSSDFIDQAKVLNGASELLTNIFGEIGIHSRAALSVNSLPLGAAVEIVSIFEIN